MNSPLTIIDLEKARQFPRLEVPYEDIFALPYEDQARAPSGSVDCAGVVVEIYRRAGIALFDPPASERPTVEELLELFIAIADPVRHPGQLFDVAHVWRKQPGHEHGHWAVLVRPDLLLHARIGPNVLQHNVNKFLSINKTVFPAPVTFYRLRKEFLDAALAEASAPV